MCISCLFQHDSYVNQMSMSRSKTTAMLTGTVKATMNGIGDDDDDNYDANKKMLEKL